ncbi:MAG: Wzy polymerase domain-containing protein [Burkholderiales bacterium]
MPAPRTESVITDHAHHLVFHTMAEFGIAGAAVPCAGLASLLLAMRRQEPTAHLWLCAVLAILGIHSMLEYPLWYAYFLGIAALGVSETAALQFGDRSRGRLLLVPMLLLGCIRTTAPSSRCTGSSRTHPAPRRKEWREHGGGPSGAATAFSVRSLHGIGAVASDGA